MTKQLLRSDILHHQSVSCMIPRLKEKIEKALEEEEQYAADELVELAEEILHQAAAVGIVHYLKSTSQKEVYNDFLVQLFNSSGHDFNAGPLFRWAANMIKDCPVVRKSEYFRFFWEVKNGKEVLCQKMQQLAELRNSVMHGFFVLPPEKNRQEADKMGELLDELSRSKFFHSDADYHFINSNGFTGKWNITDENEWLAYSGKTSFGELTSRILLEQSDAFWKNQEESLENADLNLVSENLKDFVSKNSRGAFACWIHPKDETALQRYAAIGLWLKSQNEIISIAYELHEFGISFTGSFLINRLNKLLDGSGKSLSKNKKPEEILSALRKNSNQKVVVLINNIHLALFSPQHVSQLNNFLFSNNILFIACGHHYEHFNTFFNQSEKVKFTSSLPSVEEQKQHLHNYLRFKGPSIEKTDERNDVMKLELIMKKIVEELNNKEKVIARRFADKYQFDIEYVHEVFALLHPWVITSWDKFEEDKVDELYGFPAEITEVTPIYLALGRRDLKFEYQHKILSL